MCALVSSVPAYDDEPAEYAAAAAPSPKPATSRIGAGIQPGNGAAAAATPGKDIDVQACVRVCLYASVYQ
jgi:hypothetical protein